MQGNEEGHNMLNQARLWGVIGEEEEKEKVDNLEISEKEKKKKKERMINAECRDMDNPVNVTTKMTCFIDY